ncbi:MAG TPA: phasin family protein [Stellaceae bacterium]|nr:phasin family protein [Stellaceae bacterium]
MPDEAKTIPKSSSTAEAQPAKPWLKEWEANFAPLYAMNRHAFESWVRSVTGLSSELEQFLDARLREDATLWEKLAACKNPAEAFVCQSKFAAQALADYTEAAQKFSRLMKELASGYGTGLRHDPPDTD